MPLNKATENRNPDEEAPASRKNYLFPKPCRHIQFLSKILRALRKLEKNRRLTLCAGTQGMSTFFPMLLARIRFFSKILMPYCIIHSISLIGGLK